jgi:hypothetical protein
MAIGIYNETFGSFPAFGKAKEAPFGVSRSEARLQCGVQVRQVRENGNFLAARA